MFADYHVHTEFSDDSVYPMEQVGRDAIAGGIEFNTSYPGWRAVFVQGGSYDI